MSELIVKKFSSGLVTNEYGIDHDAIRQYTAGMTQTYLRQGKGIIVVTSGAIAAGRQRAEAINGREAMLKMTTQQLAT
ncbi:hypothetical protein KA047_01295, partial [Candidatus Saccharibacteria bacterium]|nr:hypothetical protein [Candidatus Saccharibacteria bacterium]